MVKNLDLGVARGAGDFDASRPATIEGEDGVEEEGEVEEPGTPTSGAMAGGGAATGHVSPLRSHIKSSTSPDQVFLMQRR